MTPKTTYYGAFSGIPKRPIFPKKIGFHAAAINV
jgi:hypothetical protein